MGNSFPTSLISGYQSRPTTDRTIEMGRQALGSTRPVLANVLSGLGLETPIREYLTQPSASTTAFGTQPLVTGQGVGGALANMTMPQEYDPLAMATANPYSKAPQSLMGFPTKQSMYNQKGFADYNYKYEQPVKITFDDGHFIYDAINGINKPHALERARRNWEGAKIEEATQKQVEDWFNGGAQ